MKLSEIFAQLAHGELSQLAIGGGLLGEVQETDYPKLLNHINLGLASLYRRFPLKEGRLTLGLRAGQVSYSLTSTYAVSARRSRAPVRHILDSEDEPFLDDINKVERVLTDDGCELALNMEGNPDSCFTPSATMLRVPALLVDPLKSARLEVVYRATHPLLTYDPDRFDLESATVELPYSHLEALLYFVASRVHNPAGMTNEFHTGNSYSAKYEAACAELEQANLRIDQGRQNTRLERNGWV